MPPDISAVDQRDFIDLIALVGEIHTIHPAG